jgi:hypothetical protein
MSCQEAIRSNDEQWTRRVEIIERCALSVVGLLRKIF